MTRTPAHEAFLSMSLYSECESSAQLLGHGLTMVASTSWLPREPAAAFTCLASGVERLLKLSYCLSLEAAGEPFPSDKALRDLGHDLAALDTRVAERLATAASSPYMARLLNEVTLDPYWPKLLAALGSWADSSGRYRDLAILTGAGPKGDAAWVQWESASHQAASDLDLLVELGGAEADRALAQVRERLAFSILLWWHALHRAWQHDVIGARARQVNLQVDPTRCTHLIPRLATMLRGL